MNRVLCGTSPSSPNNNILIIVLISRHAPKEILSSNRSLLQQFLYLFYHSWLILLSLSSSPSFFTSAVQNQSHLCRGVYYIIIICYQSLLSPLGSQHPSLLSNSVHNSTSSPPLSPPVVVHALLIILLMGGVNYNHHHLGDLLPVQSSLLSFLFTIAMTPLVSFVCVCLCAIITSSSSAGRLLFVVGLRVQFYIVHRQCN